MKTFTNLREFYHFINNIKEDIYIKGNNILDLNRNILAKFDWSKKD